MCFFRLRFRITLIVFPFLWFFIQMYPHTNPSTLESSAQKSPIPLENILSKESGFSLTAMNDSSTQNGTRDIQFQKTLSKIVDARIRILLARERVEIFHLSWLYGELLKIQEEIMHLEDKLKEENAPEIPRNRGVQALQRETSPLAKKRGDKGFMILGIDRFRPSLLEIGPKKDFGFILAQEIEGNL